MKLANGFLNREDLERLICANPQADAVEVENNISDMFGFEVSTVEAERIERAIKKSVDYWG